MYVKFSCVFVTFPCVVLGQVWYLIVSIPSICFLTYYETKIETQHYIHVQLNTRAKEIQQLTPSGPNNRPQSFHI